MRASIRAKVAVSERAGNRFRIDFSLNYCEGKEAVEEAHLQRASCLGRWRRGKAKEAVVATP